jgi:hypothetical protein
MSSLATHGPWLSSYESDALDEDEVLSPEASAEVIVDEWGAILVYSSFADDPNLSHFVSVADLKHTPRVSSIDFSMFCLGALVSSPGYAMAGAARWPTPSLPPLPLPCPTSGRPVRNSRVNMGYSADLALETDVNQVGILPFSFEKVVVPGLHSLGTADYRHSWVQDSHLCADGSKGLFFRVLTGRTLPAGTLIGVYMGRDTANLHFSYPQAQRRFATSDYALAAPRSSYLVDGDNGSSISGPARFNDNFELFNC